VAVEVGAEAGGAGVVPGIARGGSEVGGGDGH
jgi:hypothetical protein